MEEVYVVKMAKFRHNLHSQIRKIMNIKKNINKTTTLSATVAVSKTETGMDYVQILPDNPRVGLVTPFHGRGYGQMLNNGTFDFILKPRKRGKPELKTGYSSLSFGQDGYDRVTFVLPSEMRIDFARLLQKDVYKIVKFLKDKKYSR